MKMREVNTAKIVANAESKIREQHEMREGLVKKIKGYESENNDISEKLKVRSER